MGRWEWRKGFRMGGKVASFQQTDTTPLPRKGMLVIFIMHVSQGFQVTMLFPLIVFMVTDFGVAEHNPHLVGRYAGFLASLYPFAQFCTSLLWGSVSDRTGRKPVLFLGNLVASIAAVLFGLSGSYTMACLVRVFGGLLNGVITVTKSTLGELCDKTNQRQGFAVLSLAWGIGTIIGQVVGGVAARPCQQYAIENCPAVLISYPFILPCLGAGLFSAVAAVAVCFLEETLDRGKFVKSVDEGVELGGFSAKGSDGHGSEKGGLESPGGLSAKGSEERFVAIDTPGETGALGEAYQDDELERTALLQPVEESSLKQNGFVSSGETGRLGTGVNNEPDTVARILAKLDTGDGAPALVSSKVLGQRSGDLDTMQRGIGRSDVGVAKFEADHAKGLLNHAAESVVSKEQGLGVSGWGKLEAGEEKKSEKLEAGGDMMSGKLEAGGMTSAKLDAGGDTHSEKLEAGGKLEAGEETQSQQLDLSEKVLSVEPGGSPLPTTDAAGVTLAGAWGPKGYGKLLDLEAGLDRREDRQGEKTRFYLRDPDVWVAAGAFGLTAFIHIIGDELFPIFGAAPPAAGGLGYSASSIGILGGLSGAILFLFTLVFLKLNPRSARACFAAGTALYLPATCLMPLTSLLTSAPTWQWWLAAALMIEKQIAACIGFTGAMVLVSNSSDASNMGAITGFSHSIGSFARAAGPFVGGSMWSFSVSLQLPYSQFIPWELTTVMTMLALFLVVLAKPHLDSPKSERLVA